MWSGFPNPGGNASIRNRVHVEARKKSKGWSFVEFGTLVGDGAVDEAWQSGMTADNIHPNDTAIAIVKPAMAKIINQYVYNYFNT